MTDACEPSRVTLRMTRDCPFQGINGEFSLRCSLEGRASMHAKCSRPTEEIHTACGGDHGAPL